MQDVGHELRDPSREVPTKFEKEAYHYGNEEEGHQEGCQEEKAVSNHGEAKWPR
jgi:hypothetical protein